MQVLTDNFFYHFNSGLGAERVLENERQLLVEEQKSCRVRAHKFSVETNRRRKDLEERRKQWDVQEQQLRENILQQRRQRVQDATERFQRAHLPPSQRRRQSFRKATPNIEEALNRIQGNFNSYECRSTFLSSSSTISRSCTPSPKPPTAPKPSHGRALSAVEAYTKLLQERSIAYFKNSQQMFLNEILATQEREQDTCSPQEPYGYRLNQSESLSSLDSLENVDPSHSTVNAECLNSSSERTQLSQKIQSDLCPSSDTNASLSKNLSSDDLIQWHRLHSASKARIQEECEELKNRVPNLSEATFRLISDEKSQLPLGHCNLLTLCEVIDGDTRRNEESTDQNSPRDKTRAATNINVPSCNTELQFSCLKPEKKLLDLTLHIVPDDRQERHPSATEIILSAKKDIFLEGPLELDKLLNHNNNALLNKTTQHATKEDNYPSSKINCSDSVNNLNKVSNSVSKVERSKNTGPLQQACLSNIQSDSPKCFQRPEEDLQSAGITHSDSKICEVRFIKGILKKRSKYVGADPASMYGPEHLIFARQVLAIRDSVELMKTKTKDTDNISIKKKLRWFDEVSLEEKDNEQNTNVRKHNQMKNKWDSEDHQLTAVSGASRPCPAVTPPAPTGYHFTKQAWADAGVHVSRLQEQGDEVKMPRNATKTVRPKVPRRERSARVGAGPVSSRARKGTVIRPQSATEVSQIARAQGKMMMMVPRPPPRTDATEEKPRDGTAQTGRAAPSGDYAGGTCKHAPPVEQAFHKEKTDSVFTSNTHQVIRRDSSVVYTPLPPSHACHCSEGNTKGTPISGQQESQQGYGKAGRGLMYDGKGFCLECTPTDEEISMLWHGVRSALATKDGDPKNVLIHNGPLSVSSQARANLSHVTINGDSLISGVKSVTRMGGFILSPCNARSIGRRQACDGSGARRKTCVEQSSQFPSSGNRRFPLPSQPTKQATVPRLPTTYDPALPDEGLESTAHFQLAEIHGEDMLGERDIMVATEMAKTQRPGGAHYCSQQPGLTTISLEEQRLLLSLDRLNHQLHCVQENVEGKPAARGLLQVLSEASTREGSATVSQKHRALSAENGSRNQRRF